AGLVQERYFLRQLQPDGIAGMVLLFTEIVRAFHIAPHNSDHAYGHAQRNTYQQVGEYNGYHGYQEGHPLVFAIAEHFLKNGNLAQLVPGYQQYGGQGSQRYLIQQSRYQGGAAQQQGAVYHGRQPGAAAGIDVGGRAHNYRGNRHAANQVADDIACALGTQLPVRGCGAFQRVQLFCSPGIQQGFYRSYNGNGSAYYPHFLIGNGAEVWKSEL